MKILLVNPSHYSFMPKKLVKKRKRHISFICPPLVLPYLASYMPKDSKINIVDEFIDDIDFNEKYDLVCITVTIDNACRAYEISQIFRERDILVVMGGPHINSVPQEAEKFADAIVIGELEEVWKNFLEDFNSGRIKKRYQAKNRFNMTSMPFPRHDLINWSKYEVIYGNIAIPVEGSRGCIHNCSFCLSPSIYKEGVRYRPLLEVIEEIKRINKEIRWKKKVIFFIDDDLASDINRACELFSYLRSLKIYWVAYFTTLNAGNEKLVKLASHSGCTGLFVGFESINPQVLETAKKKFNILENYIRCIKNCRKNNINLTASFIFGFPEDSLSRFYKTIEFVIKYKFPLVAIQVLVPFPNTTIYEILRERKLLCEDEFWLRPFQPWGLIKNENFSKENISLEDAYKLSIKRLYRWRSILRRSLSTRKYFLFYLSYNLLQKIITNKRCCILCKKIKIGFLNLTEKIKK